MYIFESKTRPDLLSLGENPASKTKFTKKITQAKQRLIILLFLRLSEMKNGAS
jgi:hypothetical protein